MHFCKSEVSLSRLLAIANVSLGIYVGYFTYLLGFFVKLIDFTRFITSIWHFYTDYLLKISFNFF